MDIQFQWLADNQESPNFDRILTILKKGINLTKELTLEEASLMEKYGV